jgi:hypothetical protein
VNRAAVKKFPIDFHKWIIPDFSEMPQVFGMVIPENKKQGFIQVGNDKVKVIHGEIPGTKNQINIGKPLLYVR